MFEERGIDFREVEGAELDVLWVGFLGNAHRKLLLKAGSHVRRKHKHKHKKMHAWTGATYKHGHRHGYRHRHRHRHKPAPVCQQTNKQMYPVRLRRNTAPAYVLVVVLISAFLTHVNVLVLTLRLMLASYVWTNLNWLPGCLSRSLFLFFSDTQL